MIRYPHPEQLNHVMEFDHVIRVHPAGTDGLAAVTDEAGVYAPTLTYEDGLDTGEVWELLDGYSGQHGYRGPIMHESEYIGGRMARDILERPGLYVALVCYVTDHTDCEDEDECHEIGCDAVAGWAVAHLDDSL